MTLSTQPIAKQRLNRVNIIFQPVDLCLLSPAVSAYTAAWSVLVSRLTSTCQPLDKHLINHRMIIYSAPRSSSQPLDLCLLSPTTSAYLATWSMPDSYLINDYQSLDQHLSTTLSSPFSCWISACYPLSHCLISCMISAYSAAWSVPVSQLISTCQQLDQHLSAAWLAPVSQLICTCQPVDQHL